MKIRLLGALLMAHSHVMTAAAQTSDDIIDTISERAAAYGISGAYLVRVARCESTLDPYAVGARGEQGLFQLHPRGMGLRFWRDGYTDIWSIWQQADFTSRMFASGLSFHWSCA
jgi:hypothetical protein